MNPSMPVPAVEREVLADGSVRFAAQRAWFTFHRLRPGVVLISAAGHDRGQFGTMPMDELREDLVRFAPVELFFDTSDVASVVGVTDAWADWFNANRAALKSVSVLVRSKFMHVNVEVAKFFSRTGELIRVYLDTAAFEEAIGRAAPGFTTLPPRD